MTAFDPPCDMGCNVQMPTDHRSIRKLAVMHSRGAAATAAAAVLISTSLASAQTFGPSSARPRPAPAPVETPAGNSNTRAPLTPPNALTGNACADAYYTALEPVRTGRGAVLGNLVKALRTTDPDLPGRWSVSAPASGKAKPPPKPERICAETKDVPGKAPRCVRYELKQPVIPPDVTAKLPPTADEVRVLKSVDDFVASRGALPDVGPNGRQLFVIQRVSQDIRNYVTQPRHPNMCAGSDELIEFYSSQLTPLKKRLEDLTATAALAPKLAAVRVRNVAVAEVKVYDKAAADTARIEEQRTRLLDAHKVAVAKAAEVAAAAAAVLPAGAPPTPPPAPLAEPTLPVSLTLPTKPTGPARIEDYAVVGLPSLVVEALRPLLPVSVVAKIAEEPVAVRMFDKARTALLDPTLVNATANSDVREASLMALRLLEARVYADRYVARYRELDAALFGAMTDLKAAQAASCVCRD
jgi:hypothetical protein